MWNILRITKAHSIYNKHTKNIEESIYVIFDESNDGMLSCPIVQNLNLNEYTDDEEDALKELQLANERPQEQPFNTSQEEDVLSQDEDELTNEENSLPDVIEKEVT